MEGKTGKMGCNCKECVDRFCAVIVLSDQELELLEGNCADVSFKKGDLIIKQGSLTTNVVYIKSGLVKEHMTGPNNKEEILKITKSPSFLGMPSIFGDKINHYSSTALEDTKACFIDSDIIKSLIQQNGRFAYQILAFVCEDQLYNFHRCVNKIQKQLHGCIADALLFFSDSIYNNDEFDLSITRNDLACLIGSSRESVTRALIDLSKDGIIDVNAKKIKILKKDRLQLISEAG